MYAKPFIGVSADCPCDRLGRAGYHDPLLPRWLDCISKAGGVPIIIPRLEDEIDQLHVLEHLQGFVLAGQRDLVPRPDGLPARGGDVCLETMLVRLIADRRVPFLGIGIGIQVLNVALGGSLFEIVGSQNGMYHAYPHNPRHTLLTKPGSLMERVYGDETSLVNSPHQVAIDELAVGFVVTARCRHGVVEAIESETDDWFAIGVQFSPEPDVAAAPDLKIFEEFVEEAIARNVPTTSDTRGWPMLKTGNGVDL
jgi:putative glutamine amidotransferase